VVYTRNTADFNPDEGGSLSVWNVDNNVQFHMVQVAKSRININDGWLPDLKFR
jgi:hypothetical protein